MPKRHILAVAAMSASYLLTARAWGQEAATNDDATWVAEPSDPGESPTPEPQGQGSAAQPSPKATPAARGRAPSPPVPDPAEPAEPARVDPPCGHAGPAQACFPAKAFAISNDIAVAGIARFSEPGDTRTPATVHLQPALTYFPWPQVSVGADVTLAYESRIASERWQVGAGLRLGRNFALGSRVSLWPQARFAISFDDVSITEVALSQGTRESSLLHLDASLRSPLLLFPAPHFFFGAGPEFALRITEPAGGGGIQTTSTALGVLLMLGGWF